MTSAQVATAWVRQRGRRVIPVVGLRKVDQLHDVLGSLAVELSAEQLVDLDEASRIELGFPSPADPQHPGQLLAPRAHREPLRITNRENR